jgi:hypothetical protein
VTRRGPGYASQVAPPPRALVLAAAVEGHLLGTPVWLAILLALVLWPAGVVAWAMFAHRLLRTR